MSWNWLRDFTGRAQPFTASELPIITSRATLLMEDAIADVQITGLALYASHEYFDADTSPSTLYAYSFWNEDRYVRVWGYAWLHPGTPALVPLNEAITNTDYEGDTELRVTFGTARAWTETDSDWWLAPETSMGTITATSAAGNVVLPMYSSLTRVIDFDLVTQDGASIGTGDSGLSVTFGWNLLELVPTETADSYTLESYKFTPNTLSLELVQP